MTITDVQIAKMLFARRVVGILKNDPSSPRPIGVASLILRIWLTSCEPSLPSPQRINMRAVQASQLLKRRAN
eukprot:7206625-Pyramimonas_sp.AAC.1